MAAGLFQNVKRFIRHPRKVLHGLFPNVRILAKSYGVFPNLKTHPRQPRKKNLRPLPSQPVRLNEAIKFMQKEPLIGIGIILFHTTEKELVHIVMTLRKAMDGTEAGGWRKPLVVLADNSHEWDAEGIRRVSILTDVPLHFHPTPANGGFGSGHNHLMTCAFEKFGVTHYLCLNPDGIPHPDALVYLYEAIKYHPLPAMIEARQFPSEHPKFYDGDTLETDWCSAACLIIPQFLFELTSGFDDRFFMYCEDVDLCWRVWEAGYKCVVAPKALFHHHVASRTPNPKANQWMIESGRALASKWKTPGFQRHCERGLVKELYYKSVAEMPALKYSDLHTPHVRVDFDNGFTFSIARW
jgi:hypothetical protein